MNTFDFSKPTFKNENGELVPEQTLAKVLSQFIGTEQDGNPVKLYGWHKDLQKNGKLQMDDADTADLRKLITETKRMFVFVKGQLLEVIDKK